MARNIFRQAALERIASPEQLDQALRIMTPKGWVALAAVAMVLAGAVVWGFTGSIPTKVHGKGILTRPGGIFVVAAPCDGIVQNLFIQPGAIIEQGQTLLELGQPQLLDQIRTARENIQDQRSAYERLSAACITMSGAQSRVLLTKRAECQRTMAAQEKRASWLQEKIRKEEQLVANGLITRQQYMSSIDELSKTQTSIGDLQSQLQESQLQNFSLTTQQSREMLQLEQAIREQQGRISGLQDEYEMKSRVVSKYTGRVAEIDVSQGAAVSLGTAVVKIELMNDEMVSLEAVLYFPASDAKLIEPGMKAEIEPSIVKAEEFGLLQGLVTSVAGYPSSRQSMMSMLVNDALVGELSSGGVPLETRADLIPSSRTFSGYRWSSAHGPQVRLQSGTLCKATVTVSTQRPIALVFPLIRKKLLGVGAD